MKICFVEILCGEKVKREQKRKKIFRLSWIEKKVLVTVFRFRFQVSSMCHIWIGISGFVVNHPSMRESVQGSNDTPTSFHVIIYIESDRIRLSSWLALNCYERDIENLNDQTPAIIQAWLCEVISFSRKLWFHSLDTRSSDMLGSSSKWTQFIAKGGSVNYPSIRPIQAAWFARSYFSLFLSFIGK